MSEKYYAGVVLYNPELTRFRQNLDALVPQADRILCVDNGSRNLREIREFVKEYPEQVRLVENGKNLGVAGALNQILDWGAQQGADWVLLMDQDSVAEKDLLRQYSRFLGEDTAVLCPHVVDINLPRREPPAMERTEVLDATQAITSGSYVCIPKAKAVGAFDERLFIDFVDSDFHERCLRAGYRIYRVNGTTLYHEIGRLQVYTLLGFRIYCSNHSAFRRYYMVRNRLYYRRKYFGYPAYLREKFRLTLGTVKSVIYEDEKLDKIRATAKGFRDYRKLLEEE